MSCVREWLWNLPHFKSYVKWFLCISCKLNLFWILSLNEFISGFLTAGQYCDLRRAFERTFSFLSFLILILTTIKPIYKQLNAFGVNWLALTCDHHILHSYGHRQTSNLQLSNSINQNLLFFIKNITFATERFPIKTTDNNGYIHIQIDFPFHVENSTQ